LHCAATPEAYFKTGNQLLAAMPDAKTPLAGFLQFRCDSDRYGILKKDVYRP
jgi:hypothetical protein